MSKVKIKSSDPYYKGRSIMTNHGLIEFNAEGVAEVDSNVAPGLKEKWSHVEEVGSSDKKKEVKEPTKPIVDEGTNGAMSEKEKEEQDNREKLSALEDSDLRDLALATPGANAKSIKKMGREKLIDLIVKNTAK